VLNSNVFVRAVLAAAIVAAVPAAAHAQIYAWRDGTGNLVLSDKAKDTSAATYEISEPGAAHGVKTTKPLSKRAEMYNHLIEHHAAANAVNPDLVRAVIQAESAFNPNARSHKGAMGLMQLMPSTARSYNVRNPFDPRANIEAGIKHLKSLIDRFGRLELGLAAYNAGEAAVTKFNGIPPYRETRNYVSRILAIAGIK
jgi:soluble lytic murein transglycosylase-like protein